MQLSPTLEARRAQVRRFAYDELIPLEIETDLAGGRLAPEHWARLTQQARELDLLGMCIPRALGGQGISHVEQAVVWEELGKATNGLWDVVYSPAVCMKAATPDQVERYVRPGCAGLRRAAYAISEAGAGSDPSLMTTRALRHGDSWSISGEKWHVTSGDIADYLVVQADTDAGITLFLIERDTPGIEVIGSPAYMHNFIVGHLQMRLSDVAVPHANVLGEPGQGLELSKEWFRHERLMIAARCVGAAARLIEEASAFAQQRVQFGHPIGEYQAIQFMLADSLTELWAARLMTYAAAEAEDAATSDEDHKASHVRVSMAKLYASEMAGRVADRAVQIFGGRGYMRECVAERMYRDLRVDRIWEGTSEIQRLIIARGLYKRGWEPLV
jgi:alkylation response protein AidB-like acyl-CoA dehydrogenase